MKYEEWLEGWRQRRRIKELEEILREILSCLDINARPDLVERAQKLLSQEKESKNDFTG